MLRERGEKEKRRERSKKKKKRKKGGKLGGGGDEPSETTTAQQVFFPPIVDLCPRPCSSFSISARKEQTFQHCNLGQRSRTERRERKRDGGACASWRKKKGSLCAPSKQAARTVHQSRKTVRRSRRKMPSNCAFLRINLRSLSHCGNSRERKETRRAGYRAREHARRKARIPKTRASDRALRSKPLQRASLADLAPSLSRARALFRSLSRVMLTDEIARQYETEKHLRAARPGGASGREASLEFFFPLGKS